MAFIDDSSYFKWREEQRRAGTLLKELPKKPKQNVGNWTEGFSKSWSMFDEIDISISNRAEQERNKFLNLIYSDESTKSATMDEVFQTARVEKPSAIPKKTFRDTRKEFSQSIKNRWGKLRPYQKVGLGVLGLGLIGYTFSSKDDSYNSIEGLHPNSDSLGAAVIRGMTDFGSGYKGLPDSLMGVPIDQKILDFRADVINEGKYKNVLRDIERKQESIGEDIGEFEQSDLKRLNIRNLNILNQLNSSNRNLRQVNLSDFKVTAEDADTLFLKRKGIFNLFDDQIVVRLAGIDAPEVQGHEADPLEDVRIWQSHPGGEKATKVLEDLMAQQDNLSLVVGHEKTYGRYVGAVVGDQSVLNVDLARQGAVTSLPFGEAYKDVVSRGAVQRAEDLAQSEEAGIWKMARYKAIERTRDKVGQAITYNTLTRVDKLAKNLNLGAYASFIEGMGDEERDLTREEEITARRIGYALRKTHGPKKRAYNKFQGLHPGSEGLGTQMVRSHSEFGSGWRGMIMDKRDFAKSGYETYEDYYQARSAKAANRIDAILGKESESTQEKIRIWEGKSRSSRILNLIQQALGNGQKFSGMPNSGTMSASIRGQLTEFKEDFASRWDPLRKIATEIFGETKTAMSALRNLPEFEEAITLALKTEGKHLGTGATAKTFAHKATLKYQGKEYGFEFVAKKAKSVEDLVKGEKKYSPLTKSQAEIRNELTVRSFLPKEARALSRMEEIEDNLAPSYYGMYDNSLIMEKFNVVSDFKKAKMTSEEGINLKRFMGKVHEMNLTHTDLHGENLVRVVTDRGEEAAILDWGFANRFAGNNPGADLRGQVLVNKLSKQYLGESISLYDYSKLADMKRIEAYTSGEEKLVHHMGINAVVSAKDEDMTKAAIKEVLALKNRNITSQIDSTTEIVSDSQAWGMSDFFGSEATSATEAGFKKPLKESIATVIQKPVVNKSEIATRVERIKRFNHISQQAVGSGLRTAHNAGRGHRGFSSTQGTF